MLITNLTVFVDQPVQIKYCLFVPQFPPLNLVQTRVY